MYIKSTVNRKLNIPVHKAAKLGEKEGIVLEFKAGKPLLVPDKVAALYLESYPHVFSIVEKEEAEDLIKKFNKAEKKAAAEVKSGEKEPDPVKFEVIEFLNNSSTLEGDALKEELNKLTDENLVEICGAIQLQVHINTGKAKRIDQIATEIQVRNDKEKD